MQHERTDDAIRIPLRDRTSQVVAYALLDPQDAHLAEQRWYRNSAGYAVRNQYLGGGRANPKMVTVRLHREVMQAPDGLETDHIDGDRLNNRRSNLRLVTPAENMQNKATPSPPERQP